MHEAVLVRVMQRTTNVYSDDERLRWRKSATTIKKFAQRALSIEFGDVKRMPHTLNNGVAPIVDTHQSRVIHRKELLHQLFVRSKCARFIDQASIQVDQRPRRHQSHRNFLVVS